MNAHATDMEPHRAQWKTQAGFLLAAVGSAVGLGNIWRFSYVSYENGGGAFLIPYCVALLTAGIPLMILEFGLGHRMRGSAPMSFAKLNPHWEWLGWWMVTFVMFGIALFYSVIVAWCVNYLVFAADLAWGTDPNAFFFQEFLGASGGPQAIGDVQSPILLALLVVWVINWLVVFFGVQHGIEQANKVFMPLLIVLMAVLVVWTMTLPGAGDGLARYLKPDFSRLWEPLVWRAAYAQVFFSLSLGFGIMIAYASYLPRKSNISVNAAITCLADTSFAIFAGLAVFGTLGYMANQTGVPFEQVVTKGLGLAFVAYPQAISLLPSFARLFGVLFFFALIVAGVSSLVSILEAFTSSVIDKFHYPRRIVVTVLSVLGLLGGACFTTGAGLYWIDIVDHALSEYGLFLACVLQALFVGWGFRISRIREHVNGVSSWRIGRWWDWCIRFVLPAVLLWLLIGGIVQEVREPYGGYPWLALVLLGRDWLLVTLIVALFVAARPWRRPLEREQP
ncbi:MAG TPA: sodium-dependent transporter [bacterium]